MKITPVELRGLEFKRAMHGLDPKEVKFYIDQAADAVEELLLENKSLKERLEQYEKLESIIKEAALKAEETRKAQVEQAKKEAELIIKGAQLEAERIRGGLSQLKGQRAHFLAEFKALLTSYLSLIEKEEVKPTPEITPTTDVEETAIGEIEIRE